jgi:hypothetical protein
MGGMSSIKYIQQVEYLLSTVLAKGYWGKFFKQFSAMRLISGMSGI